MSSINGLGSSSINQFLQSVSSTATTAASAISSAVNAATSSAGSTQATTPHHHHHGGGGGAMFKQIQQAVTGALQTAQNNGDTTDPNKVVQDAITKVINGMFGNSATGSGTSGANASGDTASASDEFSSPAEFFQTLKSAGVNPEDFQQDMMAAISNSNVDPSNILASIPVGSALDTIG